MTDTGKTVPPYVVTKAKESEEAYTNWAATVPAGGKKDRKEFYIAKPLHAPIMGTNGKPFNYAGVVAGANKPASSKPAAKVLLDQTKIPVPKIRTIESQRRL